MRRRTQPRQRRPMARVQPVARPAAAAGRRPMPKAAPAPRRAVQAPRPMNRGARQEVQMQDGSRRPVSRRPMR